MTNSAAAPPRAFHVVAKPRGPVCNLDCGYCFYLSKEKLYPGSDFRMSGDILELFIRQFIDAHEAPEVTFDWQGGEPTLMGIEFFRRAVELQQKFARPGITVHNSFQTNAVSLDEEWCRFFQENRFLIGVSLDGPRDVHDAYRLDKRGAPSFDRVMAGIALLQKHEVDFNILAAVHAASAGRGLEVYRFLRDEAAAQMIQFISIVERDNTAGVQENGKVTARSVTARQYGDFLIEVFDEWVRRDVGSIFVQVFDVALGIWLGQPSSLCVFSDTCGLAPALEHNGDVFFCDHFVEPGCKLGNIANAPLSDLVFSTRQREFGSAKRDSLPGCCHGCDVKFACNGGCPKDRILASPDGEPGLNYLCEGLKSFFRHIGPSMRIMAGLIYARRSPAEIMSKRQG